MPIEVVVPPLGATVDTFTLVAWYKQEGEFVEKDELLFAVETDKATLDVEAPATGILQRISAEPGDEVQALSRIALIVTPGETEIDVEWAKETSDSSFVRSSNLSTTAALPGLPVQPATRKFISPRAKRLAEERHLDWRVLTGSGPDGAIVERDVRQQLDSGDLIERRYAKHPDQ